MRQDAEQETKRHTVKIWQVARGAITERNIKWEEIEQVVKGVNCGRN